MSDVQTLLEEMKQRFNADAAGSMDEVFQYDIEGAGSWQVRVTNQTCTLTEGTPDDASVTLKADKDTLEKVLKGEEDGMQAFMSGKIQGDGDLMLAMRLNDLFPPAA
ncbi:MAG: SCP-2 family sterol carrier protein [Proteobacteria bacterium]|nr:MAG: SCP-2 family sterol carrier protein [Pseudomonadota bacterium]